MIEKADQADLIDNLLKHNAQGLSSLKESFPQLISRSGRHYADILNDVGGRSKSDVGECLCCE